MLSLEGNVMCDRAYVTLLPERVHQLNDSSLDKVRAAETPVLLKTHLNEIWSTAQRIRSEFFKRWLSGSKKT
jgi:hypothetical protein